MAYANQNPNSRFGGGSPNPNPLFGASPSAGSAPGNGIFGVPGSNGSGSSNSNHAFGTAGTVAGRSLFTSMGNMSNSPNPYIGFAGLPAGLPAGDVSGSSMLGVMPGGGAAEGGVVNNVVSEGSSFGARTLKTQTPRYGEPGWSCRPTDGHFDAPGARNDILPQGGFSYEELEAEGRLKKSVGTLEVDPSMNLGLNNPLFILSGSPETVDVFVGKHPTTMWRIHKKILVLHSEFFGAALKGPFTEGVENRVTLPEEDNNIFTLFVQWIYTQAFASNSITALLRAYVLGDKLGAFRFRQEALNKIYNFNHSSCHFTVAHALWVSENTSPTSLLRTLMMDTITLAILSKTLEPTAEEWEQMAPISSEILRSMSSVANTSSSRWTPKPIFNYQE